MSRNRHNSAEPSPNWVAASVQGAHLTPVALFAVARATSSPLHPATLGYMQPRSLGESREFACNPMQLVVRTPALGPPHSVGLQVAGALLHAFGRLLPHCLQILTVQQWQTLSFTFSATSRHHHLPPGLQRYVCLKLSLSFLFLSVSLSLSLPLFALSLSVASRAASSMRRCTTVSFSPIRCIFRKSRLKRTSLDLTGSLA